MRHQKKVHKMNKPKAHREAILANSAVALLTHGQIRTTTAKAKALKEFVDRLVTFAKRNDVHARRIVMARLRNNSLAVKNCVNFLFDKVAGLYTDRPGGYTRIYRVGFRKGDNAELVLLQMLDFESMDFKAYMQKKNPTEKQEKVNALPAEKPAIKTETKIAAPSEVIEKEVVNKVQDIDLEAVTPEDMNPPEIGTEK